MVGVLTDMALEIGFLGELHCMSTWHYSKEAEALKVKFIDAYGGVIAMRSWVDTLERVTKSWKAKAEDPAGARVLEGILLGVNFKADSTLLCKDFAPRIQTINILKSGTKMLFKWCLLTVA